MPLKKKKKAVKKAVKRKAPKKVLKKKIVKKKPVAKKKIIKKVKAKKPVIKKEKGNVIGTITHYFPKVNAAVIKLKAPLVVGDTIKVKGHTTDFT